MRYVKKLTVAMLLMAVASRGAEIAPPPEVDAYVAKSLTDWQVPGLALVIVKDDRVVGARGYGVREIGKPGRVDAETIFDIASLTKSFTAAGAAVLVDEGKLRWDDKVRERFPSVQFRDAYIDHEVTLRDLLAHRVALERGDMLFRLFQYDRAEILRRVALMKPQSPFRAEMLYSNVLYTVAGEMTAAVAGTTWAQLIQRRVVDPTGMRSTLVERLPAGENIARPHAVVGGVQQRVASFDYAMVGPSASVYTNANDMARWLRLHLNNGEIDGRRVIQDATTQEMHSPQIIVPTTPAFREARQLKHFAAYGLGWQVWDYRGEPMLWHSGNAVGMQAYMAILPKQKLGVAVMVNTWGALNLHGAIAGRVIDYYLGFTPRDNAVEGLARHKASLERRAQAQQEFEARRQKDLRPTHPISAYTGSYHDPLYGEVTVRNENGALILQTGRGAIVELSHWQYDTFRATWRDPVLHEDYRNVLVTFRLRDDGSVGGLTMPLGRETIDALRAS